MTLQPLVTVVVPAFNYGQYIAETLNSVLNQTYQNWECIVVDDGSTDQTAKVVQQFVDKDNRFQYHYHTNRGLPATRNVAIKLAKGTYFQWLDADDILQPQKIEVQLKEFLKDPDLEMVYGDLRYFNDGNIDSLLYSAHFNKPWTLTKSGNTKKLLKYLVVSCVIMPSMPLLKLSLLEKVGNFNESYTYVEDWNFWIRCFLKNINIKYLKADNSFILMRLHASSMTKNRVKMINGFLKLRNEFDTWETTNDLKSLNKYLKANDEIELYLTEKLLKIPNSLELNPSKRVLFFKSISLLSPKLSIKALQVFKSLQKKYYYFKWQFQN